MFSIWPVYILLFCRFVIAGCFLYALIGKVTNVNSFTQAVIDFRIIPSIYSRFFAILLLLSEVITLLFISIGGKYLRLGFSLAILLYSLFSIALVSVLRRKIRTSCNCFGPDSKDINHYHVIRSFGFLLLSIIGFVIIPQTNIGTSFINLIEVGFLALFAVAFIALWTNIGDIITNIAQLLSQKN